MVCKTKTIIMENKYYTPTIEEFHVGFEFEIRSTFMHEGEWKPSIIRTLENIVGLRLSDFSKNGEVRVKHLDREDIESLGWKPGGLQGLNEDSFTYEDYQLYWQDNQWIQVYNWDSKIIFEGTIKNKSELKRILKQIGVI
jgi:hypothetical protein